MEQEKLNQSKILKFSVNINLCSNFNIFRVDSIFVIRTHFAYITLTIINKNQSEAMKSTIKSMHQLSFDKRIYPRHQPDSNSSFQTIPRNQQKAPNLSKLSQFPESAKSQAKKIFVFRSDYSNYSFRQQPSKLGSRPDEYSHNGTRLSYENIQTNRNRSSIGYIPSHCEKNFNKSINIVVDKEDEEKLKNNRNNNYRLQTTRGKLLDCSSRNIKSQQIVEKIGVEKMFGQQKQVFQNSRKQNENWKINENNSGSIQKSPQPEFQDSDKQRDNMVSNQKKAVFEGKNWVAQRVIPMMKNNDKVIKFSTNSQIENGCSREQVKIREKEKDEQIQNLLLQISRQNQTKKRLREQIIDLKKKVEQKERQQQQISRKIGQLEMRLLKNQQNEKRKEGYTFKQIKCELDRYMSVNKQLESALQQQKNKNIHSNFLNSKLQNTIGLQEKRISILENSLQQSLIKLKDVQRLKIEERRQFETAVQKNRDQIEYLLLQLQNVKEKQLGRLENCKNSVLSVFNTFLKYIHEIQNQVSSRSQIYHERSSKLQLVVDKLKEKMQRKQIGSQSMIDKLYKQILNMFQFEEKCELNPEDGCEEKNGLRGWQDVTDLLSSLVMKIREDERKTSESLFLKDYQIKETVENNSQLVEINQTLAEEYKKAIENLKFQQKQIKELGLCIQNNQSVLREYEVKVRNLQIYNYQISEVCRETNEDLLVSNLKLLNHRVQQNSKNVGILQLI